MATFEFSRTNQVRVAVDVDRVRHELVDKILFVQHIQYTKKFHQVDVVNIPWGWQRIYSMCSIGKRVPNNFYNVLFVEKDEIDNVIGLIMGVAQQLDEHETRMLLIDDPRLFFKLTVDEHDQAIARLAEDLVNRIIPIENVDLEDLSTSIKYRRSPGMGVTPEICFDIPVPTKEQLAPIADPEPVQEVVLEPPVPEEPPVEVDVEPAIFTDIPEFVSANTSLPVLPPPGSVSVLEQVSVDTSVVEITDPLPEEVPVEEDKVTVRFIIKEEPVSSSFTTAEEVKDKPLFNVLEATIPNKSLCTALSKAGIFTVGDLMSKSREQVLSVPRCGVKAIDKLAELLKSFGIIW